MEADLSVAGCTIIGDYATVVPQDMCCNHVFLGKLIALNELRFMHLVIDEEIHLMLICSNIMHMIEDVYQ